MKSFTNGKIDAHNVVVCQTLPLTLSGFPMLSTLDSKLNTVHGISLSVIKDDKFQRIIDVVDCAVVVDLGYSLG